MCLLLQKSSWLRLNLPLFFIILLTHSKLSSSSEVIHLQQKNDYYYASLSTPNFPGEFKTPFNKTYIIDLKDTKMNNSTIIVYLTDVYAYHLSSIKFIDSLEDINNKRVAASTYVLTTLDYFEIQVYIADLYRNHLRLRSHPNLFGFNVSIEVVDGKNASQNSCFLSNCSYAGSCISFPGESRLEFRCDCWKGFSGPYCQFGPHCDPARNINFCLNGGVCSSRGGTGSGKCECFNGFTGGLCQERKSQTNFVEDFTKSCTDTVNEESGSYRPCTLCRNLSTFHTDSQRYVILLRNNETFNEVEKVLQTQFQPNFTITSKTSTKKGLAVEVYGQRHPSDVEPNAMAIFEAPSAQNTSRTSDELINRTTIGISKSKIKEGDEFSLTCKTIVKRSTDSVIDFKWFKDGVIIQDKYTTRPRDIAIHYPAEQENGLHHLSVLFIDKVSLADSGVFTCQVTDLIRNIQTCVSLTVGVIPLPNIQITPMSVSILRGESVILTCVDRKVKHKTEWQRVDGKFVGLWGDDSHMYRTEDMYPHGAILRVLNAQESGTFTCVAANDAGTTSKQVRIEVLETRADRFKSCIGVWEDFTEFRMSWNVTKVGQVAISPCPDGFRGSVHKRCETSESEGICQWDPTDFSRCTHLSLVQVNSTLLNLKSGFGVTEAGLDILPILMDEYIGKRKANRTQTMLFGETDPLMSILTDILEYLNDLSLTSPHLMSDRTIQRIINTTENVLDLPHTSANKPTAFFLISEFVKFLTTIKMRAVHTKHINIDTLPLVYSEIGERTIHIDKNSTLLDFEYHPVDDGQAERELNLIQFTKIFTLFNYTNAEEEYELISDMVQASIIENGETYHHVFKEGICYNIKFKIQPGKSHKKVTCGYLNTSHANFTIDACTSNVSAFSVNCCCKGFEIYAVFAIQEQIINPPQKHERPSTPPNWIATSGCLICLVLVMRSLVATLIQRVFDTFYFMTTGGIILSMILLLILILSSQSRAVALIYLTVTLFIKSLRIWRQLVIYDIHETFPWLVNMSRWISLAGILITLILPLLTVFFFDSVYSTHDDFILHQSSPVLLTFFTTFCVSNLIIFVVHYKTYLRVSGKPNNASANIRDQSNLNQNLIGTLILMIQILAVLLFWNLKQHVFFHYFFAVTNLLVGLSWKSAQNDQSNRSPKRGSSQSQQALQCNDGCSNSSRSVNFSSLSNFSHQHRGHSNGQAESRLMSEISSGKRLSSPINELQENDHDFITSRNSISTLGRRGPGSMGDYYGEPPARGRCLLQDEAEYVGPSS